MKYEKDKKIRCLIKIYAYTFFYRGCIIESVMIVIGVFSIYYDTLGGTNFMLKRVLCIAVSLGIIAGLISGCGGNAQSTSNGNPSDTSASAATTGSRQDPVTIRYSNWWSKGEQTPTLEKFMDENPGIIVQEEVLDGANYDKILKARFMSGDANDVVYLSGVSLNEYIKQNWLMDVINETGTQQMKSNDVLWKHFTRDGKIYGAIVDGTIECHPFYYNKICFDKLGLKEPTTLDEFNVLCEKIKADGIDPIVFGGADTWTITGVFISPFRFCDSLAKFDNMDNAIAEGKLGWADSFKVGYEFLESAVKKGFVSKAALTLKYDQSVQFFADGKAAMLPQGPWLPAQDAIIKADPAKFNLGVFLFPYPKGTDGKLNVLAQVTGTLAINAKTKNVDAAKKLYNFILKPENLKSLVEAEGTGSFMPGVTAKRDPILQSFFDTLYDTSKTTQHFGRGDYSFPTSLDAVVESTTQALLTGKTAKEELAVMDKEFEKAKDGIKHN